MNDKKLGTLVYEMIYQKYRIIRDEEKHLFGAIDLTEYITLFHIISETAEDEIYSKRIYLNDIAERTGFPMRQTSQFVRGMKDKGLVNWQHDGDGQEGTYMTVTPHGLSAFQETEAKVEKVYGSVMNKFGRENMEELLMLMKQLDEHLKEALTTEGIYDQSAE